MTSVAGVRRGSASALDPAQTRGAPFQSSSAGFEIDLAQPETGEAALRRGVEPPDSLASPREPESGPVLGPRAAEAADGQPAAERHQRCHGESGTTVRS